MSKREPVHYGPWVVTVTDGDTAMHHEVYASSEHEAIAEVMEHSEFYVRSPEDEERHPDATVMARRVP